MSVRFTTNAATADLHMQVERRPFPYPYRALLAICSDLDETPDARAYADIMRFLNTTQTVGSMGPGVGLEVGNTIYFDMPPDQFAWNTTDDAGRAMIAALCRSGHIDCLHSFGDFANSRDHALRALDALRNAGAQLEVWIDHAVAPSNFGADIMQGRGDEPDSPVYHADETWNYGVRYVWRGRVTSVIGQERPRSLRGLFAARHPFASARTIAKELAKGVLAGRGNEKYAIHADNRVLRRSTLRDGRPVYEFLRCNPHWLGVQHGATADGLAAALAPRIVNRLVQRGGACIFYTHLGKLRDPREPFREATRRALRHIAAERRSGRLLVATTRRLLGYLRASSEVRFDVTSADGWSWIDIASNVASAAELGPLARTDLDGLTFYVDRPQRVRVRIDGREAADVRHNPPDESGRASVSLPWPRREFPAW